MIYVVSCIVLLLAVAGMAVGVLFGGKPIRGSCGGLGCSACAGDRSRCPRDAPFSRREEGEEEEPSRVFWKLPNDGE